jgi:hypothetical protein
MKQSSGNYPEFGIHDNQEIEYYMHKARVMRAEYIAGALKRFGRGMLSLFKSGKRTAAQAGKPVRV